jgi:hypothetical protein
MANLTVNGAAMPEVWGDQTAIAAKPKAIGWVKMAPDVLRAMTMAANHANRSTSEVWAEAAREWLLRKALDADYDVLAHMPTRKRPEDALLEAKRTQLWGGIDSLMSAIRTEEIVTLAEAEHR